MSEDLKPHVNPDLVLLNAAAREADQAIKAEQAEIQARSGLNERRGSGDADARKRMAAYRQNKVFGE
jgi:hypothetical protein